jgi:hypothetical protein
MATKKSAKQKEPEVKTDWAAFPPSKSPEQLKELARDLYSGRIFTSAQIRNLDMNPDLVGMVFLPLAFGAFAEAPKEVFDRIGVVFAHMAEASPRAVNGYPTFFSCAVLNKPDWATVLELCEKIEKAVEGVALPEARP